MKIKDVKCEVYLREQPTRVRRRVGPPTVRHVPAPPGKIAFTLLRITTDDGIEGFAFGGRDTTEPIISGIKPELIGRDPFDREWIWQRLWRLYDHGRFLAFPSGALSVTDIALWDIAGKALGTPIYKLLGAYRDKIRVYASSFLPSSMHPALPTPQDYADEALHCKQQGITAYKLHVRPEIAVEACRAVREAVGDDMALMLDIGGRFNREQALRVGRELEKLNYYWFEEPVPDHDIEGLIMLREKLNIPICATENVFSMFRIPEYLIRRACDMVRCDTYLTGGITPVKKIADMCTVFGMQCELHHGMTYPSSDAANLHVQCAIKNCEFSEMIWPMEEYGIKEYPLLDNEGYLHIPQKPGLGVEIDWESLGKPVAIYE